MGDPHPHFYRTMIARKDLDTLIEQSAIPIEQSITLIEQSLYVYIAASITCLKYYLKASKM